MQYDANGNLRDDGTATYAYDALDRLIRVTRGISETTFAYNGNGDRVGQVVDGVQTTYVLDLNAALTQVLAQQGPAGTTRFLAGVGQETNGVWQYHHPDVLGSLRALTDSSGAVVGAADYTPFGAVAQATGVLAPQGFTGEFQDTGLVYLRARYYHPTLGRFLTPDSIVPDATNGQDWNAYAYVRNDPWNWTDPSGHSPLDMVNDLRDDLGDAWRWAQGQGQQLGDAWEWTKGQGQQLGDWWQAKPVCGCQEPMNTWPWQFAGIPPAIYLGFVTSPLEEKVTITLQEQRRLRWSNRWGPWRDRQVISHGPHDQHFLGLRHVDPDHVTVRPPQGLFQRAYRMVSSTSQGPRLGVDGLGGGLGFGIAIDAGIQAVDDLINNRCLSPRERAARIAVAGVFALGVGLIGASATVFATAFGAPALLATGAGIAASVGAGFFFSEVKNQALEAVTDP